MVQQFADLAVYCRACLRWVSKNFPLLSGLVWGVSELCRDQLVLKGGASSVSEDGWGLVEFSASGREVKQWPVFLNSSTVFQALLFNRYAFLSVINCFGAYSLMDFRLLLDEYGRACALLVEAHCTHAAHRSKTQSPSRREKHSWAAEQHFLDRTALP